MATFEVEGIDDYLTMLKKLGGSSDEVFADMCNTGATIVAGKLKALNFPFGKYVRIKKAKHNNYGWFAQVQFNGKTSTGASAAMAANVYEHGSHYHNRKAHPLITAAITSCEKEVADAMEKVYEEAVAK